MTTLQQALVIARSALPNAKSYELAAVLGIGGLESHFGDGFAPHNNWGAIQADPSWTGDSFEHGDSRWDSKSGTNIPYTTNFRSYPTPEAGAADLLAFLRARFAKALAVAALGDWAAFSARLYDGGYYSGYGPRAKAIADHVAAMSKYLQPLRKMLDFPYQNTPASGLIVALVVATVIMALVLPRAFRKGIA
jgi:hypothetical protein